MPKQTLFGRLCKARNFNGVQQKWKDRVKIHMTSMSMFGSWYWLHQGRKKWYDRCQERMQENIARHLNNNGLNDVPDSKAKHTHDSPSEVLSVTTAIIALGGLVTSKDISLTPKAVQSPGIFKETAPPATTQQLPLSAHSGLCVLEGLGTSNGTNVTASEARESEKNILVIYKSHAWTCGKITFVHSNS